MTESTQPDPQPQLSRNDEISITALSICRQLIPILIEKSSMAKLVETEDVKDEDGKLAKNDDGTQKVRQIGMIRVVRLAGVAAGEWGQMAMNVMAAGEEPESVILTRDTDVVAPELVISDPNA